MPTDEAYQAVLAELDRLSEAWRHHREVINRSVGMLANEVFSYDKRLKDDDADRKKRQDEVDAKFAQLATQIGQLAAQLGRLRTWQYVRIGVEVASVLIVLAFVMGRL